MKIKALLYCLLAVCIHAHAANPTTNDVQIGDVSLASLMEHLQTSTNTGIVPIFLVGSTHRFDQNIQRRLVPYGSGDVRSSSAQSADHAIRNTGLSSLRQAGRDYAEGLDIWYRLGSLGPVAADSVGGVDEELMTLDPSFQPAQQNWWKKLREGSHLRFALRPINSSPYASLSAQVKDHGNILAFTDLRFYYVDFQDPKVQFVIGIPIVDGYSLTVGTSYTFMVNDNTPDVNIRIEHAVLNKDGRFGYWYIGYRTNHDDLRLGWTCQL
jgi:hypothetical protein